MAFKLIDNEHNAYVNTQEFIVDSDEDFAILPAAAPGSVALSPSGNMKIVNASGEWVTFGK